jgi:NADH-quinone oxidoreductase subunit L
MLLGAFAALAQDDLKRVLAWSTVSQLAYITGGLAVGGVTAGMFHLLTHAAFKALLFLGAGVVLHTTGEQLMSRMGGLWRRLPLTFATMAIGSAALAGLPPLAGAFSKDSVLAAALESAHGNGPVPAWVGWLVYLAGLTTALITAAYVTRMLLLTFFGPVRGGAAVHRAPVVMTAPLVALAVPAALLGAVAGLIGTWMPALVPGTNTVHISVAALGLTTGLVIVGAGAAVAGWRRARGTDPAQALGRALPVLRRGFLLDDVQDAVVVRPYRRFARAVLGIDSRIVDGAVRGCGVGARVTGGLLSRTQSGNVQSYVSGVVAASVVLALVAAIVLPFVVLA